MKKQEHNLDIFNKIDQFLKNKDIVCAENTIFKYAEERKKINGFDLSRHIKGLIYSLLSNNTKWKNIESKLGKIDDLFFDYDVALMKRQDGEYFSNGIFSLKCGNISTKGQMASLHQNISILELIDETKGGIDNYYNSIPAHKLVTILSAYNSVFKLKYVGKALAWEYLGNVGIDRIKPDVHTRRIMGANRLGYSAKPVASEDEVVSAAKLISSQTGLSLSMIDALLWSFCVEEKGNICTITPNCPACPIAKYCNKVNSIHS